MQAVSSALFGQRIDMARLSGANYGRGVAWCDWMLLWHGCLIAWLCVCLCLFVFSLLLLQFLLSLLLLFFWFMGQGRSLRSAWSEQQQCISSGMCSNSGLCCVSASVAWRVVLSRGARSVPSAYRQSRCAAGRHRSRAAVCANQCRCAIVRVSSWHVLQPSARPADKCGSGRACVNGGLRAG